MNYKRITLSAGKEKSLLRSHPWLFSGAISNIEKEVEEGDLVSVYAADNRFIASGFYQQGSIAVKVLTFEQEDIDERFWLSRVADAITYRKSMGLFDNEDTTIFRLINGEGDFLPSLIADYYEGLVVVQFHSVGMFRNQEHIVAALLEVLGKSCKAIFSKSSSTLPKKGGIFTKDEFIYGQVDSTWTAKEHGLTYQIDYAEGQKTGFFIDQRDNRQMLQQIARGKRVLNAFGYTGGFSVSALAAEAKSVLTLDISKRAIELCDKNVEMNFADAAHKAEAVDVLEYLNELNTTPDEAFEVIILDPPAFAKHTKDLKQGLKGYRTINQKAIEKIAKGGFLFTFSCSQTVSVDDFATMLFSSAALARRNVRIVKRLHASYDHPQSIYHPEGEYLKGFLLYVE
ncbi:MAG: class I SAM-dependent rRNA methyltransferase [Bacteroidales bacterium]|jgi:23S rRNA (cytosine1962-C5)-methyltransferase|nr:class I SAM-dependent rRNA methyltransferase [Bacteroidales bacterium]